MKPRTRPVLEIDYRILSVLAVRERQGLKTAKTKLMQASGTSYALYKDYFNQMLKANLIREKRTNGRIYIEMTEHGKEILGVLRSLINQLIQPSIGRMIID